MVHGLQSADQLAFAKLEWEFECWEGLDIATLEISSTVELDRLVELVVLGLRVLEMMHHISTGPPKCISLARGMHVFHATSDK